jgi:hypothetical protein
MLSQITTCVVNNGKSTFFWHDRWLLTEPLSLIYPALYTHHLSPQARVADVMQSGIEANLRPRLTSAASADLSSLLVLLQEQHFSAEPDRRTMLCGAPFSSKEAYIQLHSHLANADLMPIWKSRLPHRIRVFAWLLYMDRLNTREKLANKTIIDDSSCPLCADSVEDREHLFFSCPAAQAIWTKIGIPPLSFETGNLWTTSRHTLLSNDNCTFAITAIFWRIWDARNSLIFRQENVPPSSVINRIMEDISLWSHRIKNSDHKAQMMLWRNHLSSCNM